VIDSSKLLNDLRKLLVQLEDDIRERSDAVPDVKSRLETEHSEARAAERTASTFVVWRDEQVTQAGVAWILGCVFVRFMEDSKLIQEAWIAGAGDRLSLARDQHTQFFREHPRDTDRDYLLYVFDTVMKLPAVAELFDEKHNPLWRLQPSGDGAQLLLQFFQKIDPGQGGLIHDFTDPEWNTRFLGDLYQDLSESAQKKYALLQTPEFVEEFILDRTLDPAIDTFGLKELRLIDPACGSGHFLLGAFARILRGWLELEPGINPRELVQRALKSVYGVDLNPFAVAIARFRILVAALQACGVKRIKDSPNFHFNLAVGDSLLHGPAPGELPELRLGHEAIKHSYPAETPDAIWKILSKRFHAVVGNPPYITVKDKSLNRAYRSMFESCHRQYSLAVPFMERFFDLAIPAKMDTPTAGFVGMITTNTFMKREFGKKLVEEFIPEWDVTHVIDTSGAYIPGHGTPTVILLGRCQHPTMATIRVAMGIRGEPSTPPSPQLGKVWTSIVRQIDVVGSSSDFIECADMERVRFHSHPWSIGGGAGVLAVVEAAAVKTLAAVAPIIGRVGATSADDIFVSNRKAFARQNVSNDESRPLVTGEDIRDWTVADANSVIFLYSTEGLKALLQSMGAYRWLWPCRTILWSRATFSDGSYREAGRTWWEWHQVALDRLLTPWCITFASVSTHNHFVLERTTKVFKQSAPIIKLPSDAGRDNYVALLGMLNCSTACFWMKQVFHCKGSTVDQHGARQTTVPFEDFYDLDSTKLKKFPLPDGLPLVLASEIAKVAKELAELSPEALCSRGVVGEDELAQSKKSFANHRGRMIALQEELDWQCYRLYGLVDADDQLEWPENRIDELPPLQLGERAFEILMARQMKEGTLETTWFDRHKHVGSKPITEPPSHWPADYRDLYFRRYEAMETSKNLKLIERPEYKRRWNTEPWELRQERALREWLLSRLEEKQYWKAPALASTASLADRVRQDGEFMQVAELYRGRPDFDVAGLVEDLATSDAVPILPIHRYKAPGLRKRGEWERVWNLQRREDAVDAELDVDESGISDAERLARKEKAEQLKLEQVGKIPVPPKYKSSDFRDTIYWRLRGKLDVPRERFVLFPGCERDADPTPVLTWAGWNHLEQAQAIAAYYEQVRNEGWSDERRVPLLASVLELVPWLKQWHNEYDSTYGMRLGDFFEDFVTIEARAMDKTVEDIRRWTP